MLAFRLSLPWQQSPGSGLQLACFPVQPHGLHLLTTCHSHIQSIMWLLPSFCPLLLQALEVQSPKSGAASEGLWGGPLGLHQNMENWEGKEPCAKGRCMSWSHFIGVTKLPLQIQSYPRVVSPLIRLLFITMLGTQPPAPDTLGHIATAMLDSRSSSAVLPVFVTNTQILSLCNMHQVPSYFHVLSLTS